MKKILVINDSSLLRAFLERQLSEYDFNVQSAINGLDGSGKIRGLHPDLVIMDYFLTRRSSMDVLKSMKSDPNTSDIPVIMTVANVDKGNLLEIARLGVKKVLSKPVKIDALLAALTELLGVAIEVDDTPCILDAHLNDRILFVEIARGFNREKINLLRYKITELFRLYKVQDPRILILMTDIDFRDEDKSKLQTLLEEVIVAALKPEHVRVLTANSAIRAYLGSHPGLNSVEVSSTLEEAVDGLLGVKGMETLTAEQDNVQNNLFSSKQDLNRETFQLNFSSESAAESLSHLQESVRIAVVDDDLIVREIVKNSFKPTGWKVDDFANGLEFVGALEEGREYDLLFLDLLMPEMNGFAVLQVLSAREKDIPTIILTALSRKESVIKAREFGVDSYLIKPIKPDGILAKAAEILGADF